MDRRPLQPLELIDGERPPSFMRAMAMGREVFVLPTPGYSDFDAADPAWRQLVRAERWIWKPRIR